MKFLTSQELKKLLDGGQPIQLVNALDRYAYDRMHIPGSLHFGSLAEMAASLSPEVDVVVYCSNPECPASIQAYYYLERRGFDRLYRFAGGLMAWEAAGYPLAGEKVPV